MVLDVELLRAALLPRLLLRQDLLRHLDAQPVQDAEGEAQGSREEAEEPKQGRRRGKLDAFSS